ncbi:MAG TPA: hypothetical protein VEK39_14635 [Solirubrobacterales bacterium]|nr:hypothetical protein [Solirubrobacterales bacterium]
MSRTRSVLRAEYLLPIACLLAAACVAAAEFSTLFEFNRGTSGEPLRTIEAADRHHYALLVLAVFAVVALAVAVLTGSRPAATAVAVAGGLALLIFLLVDLPDVNQEGSLDDPSFEFFSSKAEPANGFWLELIGTVSLALAGGALATLRSDQLRTLVPERYRSKEEPGGPRRRSSEPSKLGKPGAAARGANRDEDKPVESRSARAAAARRRRERAR